MHKFLQVAGSPPVFTPHAFVNLTKAETATRFLEEFAGFRDWGVEGAGPAETSWSTGGMASKLMWSASEIRR